jgi:hypothetical protein
MAANEGRCTYCGSQFPRGWCLSKHMRACAANTFVSTLRVEGTTDARQHDPMSEADVDDVAEDAIAAAPNIFQQPQAQHRERYRLNAKHLETLKFLGPMCAGQPVGDEKLKAMLKYAKSLDSLRVHSLPKTPATAWRRLAKVRNNISHLLRSASNTECTLQEQFFYITVCVRCNSTLHYSHPMM